MQMQLDVQITAFVKYIFIRVGYSIALYATTLYYPC